MAGSVSGGCVEGATATEIGEAIGRGTPKLVTFGVTPRARLGGGARVRRDDQGVRRAGGASGGAGRGAGAGRRGGGHVSTDRAPAAALRIFEDGRVEGPSATACRWTRCGRRPSRRSAARPAPPRSDRHRRGPRRASSSRSSRASRGWSIFGGVHIAVALVPLARALGYRTIVADGRPAFLTPGAVPRRRPAASSPGPRTRSSRSGSTRRATSASCRTIPSSTSPRCSSRSARRRATSARSARARRRRPGATGCGARGSATSRHRPGARTDRPRPGRPPARRDRAGDPGGDDGGALRCGARARSLVVADRGGRLVRRPLLALAVAGRRGTGPIQMTQLFPGREAWVARADHEFGRALRMVIFTPRCQRYCSANGSVRRE